jgi:energy-converting hydrogenase Eha subunit B
MSSLEGGGLGEMKSVSGMRTLGEGKERDGTVEVGGWFGESRACSETLLMATNLGSGGNIVLVSEGADDGTLNLVDFFPAEREE